MRPKEGVLNIAFHLAEEEGLLLLDLKDLLAMLAEINERRKEISAEYGNVSTASIGAIQLHQKRTLIWFIRIAKKFAWTRIWLSRCIASAAELRSN